MFKYMLSVPLLASCALYAADTSTVDYFSKDMKFVDTVRGACVQKFEPTSDQLKDGKKPWAVYSSGHASGVSWIGNNRILASANNEMRFWDWDRENDTFENGCLFALNQYYNISTFTSVGETLVLSKRYPSRCASLEQVDMHGSILRVFSDTFEYIYDVSTSVDGTIVAAIGNRSGFFHPSEESYAVEIYDIRSRNVIGKYFIPQGFCTKVSPDGKKIAFSQNDGVSCGFVGSELLKRTGSTTKQHAEVQSLCFTPDGGLYSGDLAGLLVSPTGEEVCYYPTDADGNPIKDMYRNNISSLAYHAGTLYIVANNKHESRNMYIPERYKPITIKQTNGTNTYFDITHSLIDRCAINKSGDVAFTGDVIKLLENKDTSSQK